jgi:hypothetical protein
MGVNDKEPPANGSIAMGKTRRIAFARMYITPKDPHTDPNTVMVFVNGHDTASPSFDTNNAVPLLPAPPPPRDTTFIVADVGTTILLLMVV